MKFSLKILLFSVISLVFLLLIIRLVLPSQVDDVSPLIYCEDKVLDRADIYYVIVEFEGVKISENKEWCEKILSYNKRLEMHGIRHSYNEFEKDISEEEILEGIKEFENCFGFKPEKFKPPQLKISKENKIKIEKIMDLDLFFNQFFHKTYHCNDTGLFPNWVSFIF